jgi:hypothetical protein
VHGEVDLLAGGDRGAVDVEPVAAELNGLFGITADAAVEANSAGEHQSSALAA